MTSLKEEIALVLAKYTTKIIKEGDVDPTIHYQILELIEKRLDYYIEEADGKEEEVDLLNIMKEELLK